MMNLPKYEDYEQDFLKAIAIRLCFSGKTELAFLQRFKEDNGDLTNKRLAEVLDRELIEGTKEKDAPRVLRDCLKVICDKLVEAGCEFNGTNKSWKIAKRWLREVKFPEWVKEQSLLISLPLTIEQLWQQLRENATHTNKMGPRWVELDMFSSFEESVPLGSNIVFDVNLERAGYLILLEKGTSGDFYCLCPSFFAPELHYPAGRVTLPQPSSSRTSFKISGNPGKEEIVAIIAQEVPNLNWLPKAKLREHPPLKMREDYLQQLLEYLDRRPDSQVFYMEYTVTA